MKKIIFSVIFFSLLSLPGFAQDVTTVSKVINGNTIELATGERVRLIGVNLPEKNLEETTDLLKRLSEGRDVRLQYDENGEKKDSEGNLLAYVFVTTSIPNDIPVEKMNMVADYAYIVNGEATKETFLNAMVIRAGLGLSDESGEFLYKPEFKDLQQEAQDKKRGIWAD